MVCQLVELGTTDQICDLQEAAAQAIRAETLELQREHSWGHELKINP
jgi:hypothetical protein